MKTYFNWSTGKDSAMALHELMANQNIKPEILLTSINGHHDRVSMHGLRTSMLKLQAEALDIPLKLLQLPEEPTMEEYAELMKRTVEELKAKSFTHAAFGDIFLEDLKEYREKQLKAYDIDCLFPIWKRDTKELMQHFINSGFKAIVVCIKSELLDESFCGRLLDQSFVDDLPDNVDPCGENGEFHTFCFDGPIFSAPLAFELGEKVYREYTAPKGQENKNMGFWFQDLLPN